MPTLNRKSASGTLCTFTTKPIPTTIVGIDSGRAFRMPRPHRPGLISCPSEGGFRHANGCDSPFILETGTAMFNERNRRIDALHQALPQRILILDGAMGTMIQSHRLREADFRGERFADWHRDLQGNNDLLCLTQPQLIEDLHRDYLAAGADIIETNTFNSTRLSQADYGLEDLVAAINLPAVACRRRAAVAAMATSPERPRWVAGVLGPTSRTATLSPDVNDPGFRNVTFDQLVDNYSEATRALIEGGVDLIMIET